MNLTQKFSVAILFITLLAVSVFTDYHISEQKKILNNELNQKIALLRSNIESNAKNHILSLKYEVENDLAAFNFSHIDTTFNYMIQQKDIDAVFLLNLDKKSELSAGNSDFKDELPTEEINSVTIGKFNDKNNNFIISIPIVLNNKWGELHIVYSTEKLQEEVEKAEKIKQDEVTSSVRKAIVVSVFLAVVLLLTSYFFVKRVLAPIMVLTETAKRMATGNLDISDTLSGIKSNDEIGQLSTSFIYMSTKLNASYKALSVLNKNLEYKTQELQELNASLEERVTSKVAKIREQEKMIIAQSRLAVMGEMMSMIAHQWRQPLATATLMIANEKIKLMAEGKDSDNVLDKISDMVIYLSGMIDDFQTYFKPNKSSEKISTQILIERTVHIIQTRLEHERVKLHLEKIEEQTIETYPNEVVQVLINIINNSIDAFIERKVAERHIRICVYRGDDDVTISVEDNGGGIGNEIIGNIFEPYFSTKSKNGTGLGLYMAKMIIEKHIGGTLRVVNVSNGARFTIVLSKIPVPSDAQNESDTIEEARG